MGSVQIDYEYEKDILTEATVRMYAQFGNELRMDGGVGSKIHILE